MVVKPREVITNSRVFKDTHGTGHFAVDVTEGYPITAVCVTVSNSTGDSRDHKLSVGRSTNVITTHLYCSVGCILSNSRVVTPTGDITLMIRFVDFTITRVHC